MFAHGNRYLALTVMGYFVAPSMGMKAHWGVPKARTRRARRRLPGDADEKVTVEQKVPATKNLPCEQDSSGNTILHRYRCLEDVYLNHYLFKSKEAMPDSDGVFFIPRSEIEPSMLGPLVSQREKILFQKGEFIWVARRPKPFTDNEPNADVYCDVFKFGGQKWLTFINRKEFLTSGSFEIADYELKGKTVKRRFISADREQQRRDECNSDSTSRSSFRTRRTGGVCLKCSIGEDGILREFHLEIPNYLLWEHREKYEVIIWKNDAPSDEPDIRKTIQLPGHALWKLHNSEFQELILEVK